MATFSNRDSRRTHLVAIVLSTIIVLMLLLSTRLNAAIHHENKSIVKRDIASLKDQLGFTKEQNEKDKREKSFLNLPYLLDKKDAIDSMRRKPSR